jgi:hypothetical protein
MNRRPSKLYLTTSPSDQHAAWFVEAAHRAGLIFTHHADGHLPELSTASVIILCGSGALESGEAATLARWVEMGGTVLCVGGTWGLEPVLGLEQAAAHSTSRDWIVPAPDAPWWPKEAKRSAFWGGPQCRSKGADVLLSSEDGNIVFSRSGRWLFFAPHLAQTLAVTLMGQSVETDKPGPGDGSAETMDGILRSEDGTFLDWQLDRSAPHKGQPFFAEPWADILTEIWTRVVLTACDAAGVEPIKFWQWPHGWEGVASISVDFSDGDPGLATSLLYTFAKFGIRASWMAGSKGVPMDVFRQLKRAEQSLGLLFHGSETAWNKEELRLEMLALARANGVTSLAAARPQKGGWQGWDQFYQMTAAAGCRVSLSKGGMQPGTSGAIFGTTRPFIAHGRGGKSTCVVEIPFLAALPGLEGSATAPLVDMTCDWNGCFHARMDLANSREPGFERSLQNLVMLLRQRRLLLMGPDQIAHFETHRRSMQVKIAPNGEISLMSEGSLPGLTLLTSPQTNLQKFGQGWTPKPVERHGRKMLAWTLDVEARAVQRLMMDQEFKAA